MTISYVVTSYNKASYLEATLASIVAERADSGGEIVIVDDGSTDHSRAILARFGAAHRETRVIAQANRGVVAATNVGFTHARHDAIRFCDADDLLCAGSSHLLLAALADTGAGLAFGRHETYRNRPERPVVAGGTTASVVPDALRLALTRNLFSPSSTLVTRRIAEQILPLPEHFRSGQDYMMGVRASLCSEIARTGTTLSVGPESDEDRLSADKGRMYGETAAFLAEEIAAAAPGWRRGDGAFALQRNAGRAQLWARRNGRPLGDRAKLLALKLGARWHDEAAAARALAWIATTIYHVEIGQPPL